MSLRLVAAAKASWGVALLMLAARNTLRTGQKTKENDPEFALRGSSHAN